VVRSVEEEEEAVEAEAKAAAEVVSKTSSRGIGR